MAPTTLSRTLHWHGRTIAWDRFGDGPPLVLLHGTPWSSRLWRPIARALSRDFTVYLWDMPGYGESSKDAEHAVDLGVQGALFADLLQEWNLTRPLVVAHDFGGAVALRAHLLHSANYAALCLVDVVTLSPWGSPFFTLVQQHPEVFSQLPPAIHRGVIDAYVRGASHHGLREDSLDVLTAPWLSEIGQAAFYRQIAQAEERFTDEIESQLGTLDLPVHIVWGTEDTWIPVDRADRLHQTIPGSTLTRIEGAGHLVQLDAEAALASELTQWANGAAS